MDDRLELAGPDTFLGQLQRGLGAAARTLPRVPLSEAVAAFRACFEHDPRWHVQFESRHDQYARLALTSPALASAVIASAEDVAAHETPGPWGPDTETIPMDTLGALRVRGNGEATAALRRLLGVPVAFAKALRALLDGRTPHVAPDLGTLLAARTDDELRDALEPLWYHRERLLGDDELDPRLAALLRGPSPYSTPVSDEPSTVPETLATWSEAARLRLRPIEIIEALENTPSPALRAEVRAYSERAGELQLYCVAARMRAEPNVALPLFAAALRARSHITMREGGCVSYALEVAGGPALRPLGLEWVDAPEGALRVAGERILADWATADDSPLLLDRIEAAARDDDPWRVVRLAWGVRRADAEGVARIVDLMRSIPYAPARGYLYETLGRVAPTEAAGLAAEGLHDADVLVRSEAIARLPLDGPDARRALAELADDPLEGDELRAEARARLAG